MAAHNMGRHLKKRLWGAAIAWGLLSECGEK